MKKITKYEAFDGEVFDTEEECLAHEKIHDFKTWYSKGLKVYNRKKQLIAPLDLINDTADGFDYFRIPNEAVAQDFLAWMDLDGYCPPKIREITSYPAYFYYDTDRDIWVNLDKAICDLGSIYDIFKVECKISIND